MAESLTGEPRWPPARDGSLPARQASLSRRGPCPLAAAERTRRNFLARQPPQNERVERCFPARRSLCCDYTGALPARRRQSIASRLAYWQASLAGVRPSVPCRQASAVRSGSSWLARKPLQRRGARAAFRQGGSRHFAPFSLPARYPARGAPPPSPPIGSMNSAFSTRGGPCTNRALASAFELGRSTRGRGSTDSSACRGRRVVRIPNSSAGRPLR